MAKLLAFALLHFVLQAKLTCYSRYLLTSYFCIPVPYDEKDIFVCVCVSILEGLEIFTEPFNFSFFNVSDWGIDLDYCDIEYFALEMNRDMLSFFRLHPNTAF